LKADPQSRSHTLAETFFFCSAKWPTTMKRREFLHLSGSAVVAACVGQPLVGCRQGGRGGDAEVFPLGVASGDPRPGSVVLWTRLNPQRVEPSPVSVSVEVAIDEAFTALVVERMVMTNAQADHTLRVLVQDLQPDTIYYYRFSIFNEYYSPVGRTWTAPAVDSTAEIRFAVMSCQDFSHGFFVAYRRLLDDDLAAGPSEQLRFVLHLGDFIYETTEEDYQAPLDDNLEPLPAALIDRSGKARRVSPFPQGATAPQGFHYAKTVEDYRHLYRTFLSDPDLQAARARWPFLHTWDDHEFSDDCWQSEANYLDAGQGSSTDEPSQPRRVAATQAWAEYTPVNLTTPDGALPNFWEAQDFSAIAVNTTRNDSYDDSGIADNADNRAAIGALRLYRQFRFGSLVDLLVTDNRSYRSDHAIPEDISGANPLFLHPRMALPLELLNALDAGRTANDGSPDTFIYVGQFVLNPRRHSPPGSLLGVQQKAWWKNLMANSTARWRLWGNSVPLLRLKADLSAVDAALPDVVLSGDSWDGYHSERTELMSFLRDAGIGNVVSLAGDHHAHFAGLIMDDYEGDSIAGGASAPQAVAVELVCAATASVSQFAAVERLSRRASYSALEQTLRNLITYDARLLDPSAMDAHVVNLNNTLLNGARAAVAAANTHSAAAVAAAARSVNPHLQYADTHAHGYGLIHVTAEQINATLVTIAGINEDTQERGPQVLRRAKFVIPSNERGGQVRLQGPEISGTSPFPWSL
jgi:alkaline phosphatase D